MTSFDLVKNVLMPRENSSRISDFLDFFAHFWIYRSTGKTPYPIKSEPGQFPIKFNPLVCNALAPKRKGTIAHPMISVEIIYLDVSRKRNSSSAMIRNEPNSTTVLLQCCYYKMRRGGIRFSAVQPPEEIGDHDPLTRSENQ